MTGLGVDGCEVYGGVDMFCMGLGEALPGVMACQIGDWLTLRLGDTGVEIGDEGLVVALWGAFEAITL